MHAFIERGVRALTFFAHEAEAVRYSRSRPFFHPLVIERIQSTLQLSQPVTAALDVGCGTGQSTVALKPIAHSIVGIDISRTMLDQATSDERVQYREASAEDIPFSSGSFDLITVSLAFHWLDRRLFLKEANRLLRDDGWLVVYNNGFTGQMKENPAFAEWMKAHYLQRFPTPPRDSRPLTSEEVEAHGFRFVHDERYQNEVSCTAEELAGYLTTQTNVAAAIAQGTDSVDSIFNWLVGSIRPTFVGSNGTFVFGGYIWYLQKVSNILPL